MKCFKVCMNITKNKVSHQIMMPQSSEEFASSSAALQRVKLASYNRYIIPHRLCHRKIKIETILPDKCPGKTGESPRITCSPLSLRCFINDMNGYLFFFDTLTSFFYPSIQKMDFFVDEGANSFEKLHLRSAKMVDRFLVPLR